MTEERLLKAFREVEDVETRHSIILAVESAAFVSGGAEGSRYGKTEVSSPNAKESQNPGDLRVASILRNMNHQFKEVWGMGENFMAALDESRECEDNPTLAGKKKLDQEEKKERADVRLRAHLTKKLSDAII